MNEFNTVKPSKLILLIVIFGSFFNSYSQEIIDKTKTQETLQKYFELPRESIFLHVNKSTFIVGESVWFKGYIYNRKQNKPFIETSNVYVGIYDEKGVQVKKSLYLAKNGYLKGAIPIDSTYTSGKYYVKAQTNWMKNFKEEDSFVQKIEIINKPLASVSEKVEKEYDIQFLPEGGNFVSDIENNVGIKAIDSNGYGVQIENVVVYDEYENEVTKFSTSHLGHATISLIPRFGAKYHAKIQSSNGDESIFNLPIAKEKGINIILKNNSRQKQILVSLTANEKIIDDIFQEKFYVLIHKNGYSKKIDITFSKEKTNRSFVLDGADLPIGVNTVTFFNSNDQPVLERLFFNASGLLLEDVKVEKVNIISDSIEVILKNNLIKKNTNISVSVLPTGTISHNFNDNIFSTFYLKPYLSGFIEKPSYYFEKMDSKKEYELDMLLLIQGWSRYSWKNIFSEQLKPKYLFERGVTLNGVLNREDQTSPKIFIFPTLNHTSMTIDVVDNKFSVANYFLNNNEKMYVVQSDDKGKQLKPNIYLSLENNNVEDRLFNFYPDNTVKSKLIVNNNQLSNLKIEKNTIELNEVVITENITEKKIRKNSNVLPYIKRFIKLVDEDLIFSFPDVVDLIRSKGYDVRGGLNFGSTETLIIKSYRDASLLLILDGVRQPSLNILDGLKTSDLESYYFDKLNRYNGVTDGFQEVLYLFTRSGGDFLSSIENNKRKAGIEFIVDKGFEQNKVFYLPKYKTFNDEAFNNLGVIHWEPEIFFDQNGIAKFYMLNTLLKDVTFYIEGMSDDGTLLSNYESIIVE